MKLRHYEMFVDDEGNLASMPDENGLYANADEAEARIAELEKQKDRAYQERNRLVAALTYIFPNCSLGLHPAESTEWDADWRNIVYIETPHGQLSWHIHDSELPLFSHLPRSNVQWDGHTTEEKYNRLARCSMEDFLRPFVQAVLGAVDNKIQKWGKK